MPPADTVLPHELVEFSEVALLVAIARTDAHGRESLVVDRDGEVLGGAFCDSTGRVFTWQRPCWPGLEVC
jgi:hypothetical protein